MASATLPGCARLCMDCVQCLAPLPEGKTCSGCARYRKCKAFGVTTEEATSCDWLPSRWMDAERPALEQEAAAVRAKLDAARAEAPGSLSRGRLLAVLLEQRQAVEAQLELLDAEARLPHARLAAESAFRQGDTVNGRAFSSEVQRLEALLERHAARAEVAHG